MTTYHRPQGNTYERIYAAVRRIPCGRVATYGQIARLAGIPRQARQVGYALHALPAGSDVPWHRVVNASGRISRRAESYFEQIQRGLLAQEGVAFKSSGDIALDRFQWNPAQNSSEWGS
ncbi:MAG: MGMT family protein [Gammaproteobacteria bacterium]|nr:MGMT family protein [Gammaproteobacteria bacterium]